MIVVHFFVIFFLYHSNKLQSYRQKSYNITKKKITIKNFSCGDNHGSLFEDLKPEKNIRTSIEKRGEK